MKQPLTSKSKAWTVASVERTRATVRTIVAAKCKKMTLPERLSFLAKQILLLEGGRSDLEQLLRFFYVLALLEHHGEHGGVTEPRLKEFRNLARATLQSHGIRVAESRLSYLYSEIHLAEARSRLHEGQVWGAVFEQQRARHLGLRGGKRIAATLALGGAKSALRLGRSELALKNLAEAVAVDLPPLLRQAARLQQVVAVRLTGRLGEAEQLLATFAADLTDEGDAEEWQWEGLRQTSLREGSIAPLVAAVRRGSIHHLGKRLLEVSLYTRAAKETSTTVKLGAAIALITKKRLADDSERFLRSVVLTFDDCYNRGVALERSLAALGKLADEVRQLPTVEQELLFWLAVARWSARHHATPLAQLAFSTYKLLSSSLSDGRQPDVLGLAPDLFERPWAR